jgi:exodeoxyribonuclease VII large subunit
VNKILDTNKHKLSMATSKISGASPERLLKLGYSITRVNGRSLRDIHQLKAGMEIMTTLSNGSFSSTVNRAKPKEPVPPVHLVPPGYNDKLA